jgi:hypothetical protein
MAVKSSYWTFLPSASVSGGFNYTGSGSSNFGGTNVVKTSASVGSSYSIDLGWTLDGRVINAPGESKANLRPPGADRAARCRPRGCPGQYLSCSRQCAHQT